MEEYWDEVTEQIEEQVELPEPVFEKKTMKKDVRRIGWGLIFYTLILYGIVIADMVIRAVMATLKSPTGELSEQQIEALAMSMEESAVSMMVGVGIGALFLWRFLKKQVSVKAMFEERKPMDGRLFFQLLSVFMAVQLVFSWIAGAMEAGLNMFGYSAMASIEAATSSSTTISMFVYASFVAPVVEELVYRGFVMGVLRKYGKVLAIVISSVLFGMMHGNIPQALFAFSVGLVLGYVAEEYSLKWAIAIHMMNNFVFAEVVALVGKVFGENAEAIVNGIVLYGFFFVGTAIYRKNFYKIQQYVEKYAGPKVWYRYVLTTLPILLFIIVNFFIGLIGIQPL